MNDIPEKLEIGKTYTAEQLKLYSTKLQNEGIYFISDNTLFDNRRFVIEQIIENKNISFRGRNGFMLGNGSSDKMIVILKHE